MEDKLKIEKWTLDDGRRAERHVKETSEERVIELHVEDERPLRLQQRVIEKSKPFVYEREIEVVDKEGNVVEKKVEAIEPKVHMQLVEHLATVDNSVAAQSVKEDCDCHITKEEMVDTIISAIKASRSMDVQVASLSMDEDEDEDEDEEKPRKKKVRNVEGIRSLGLAEEIANKEKSVESNDGMTDKVLMGFIIILVVGLAYMLFGM